MNCWLSVLIDSTWLLPSACCSSPFKLFSDCCISTSNDWGECSRVAQEHTASKGNPRTDNGMSGICGGSSVEADL